MIQVELKPLFARLNPYSTKALENAAGLTLARNHYEISLEHFLRLLLEDPNADFTRILQRFEIDPLRLGAQLDDSLAQLKNGNPGRPVFAGLLTEWVQDAWLIASLVLRLREASPRCHNLVVTALELAAVPVEQAARAFAFQSMAGLTAASMKLMRIGQTSCQLIARRTLTSD